MAEKFVLEVNHLNSYYKDQNKLFGKIKRTQVLKDVSFQIKKGEVLGLVGESGSGKSTLSKAILSLVKDVEGEIHHYTKHPQMVFQDPYSSLNPSKKIGWILEEPLRVQKRFNHNERQNKVKQMANRVGLEEKMLLRYPSDLSGGQRQRVSIALALISGAKFIIADEPVSALDVTIQKQILDLLLELQEEEDLSYLFISHDLAVIFQMCDRVMVMKDGEIVEEGLVDELFAHPKHPYTKRLIAASLGED